MHDITNKCSTKLGLIPYFATQTKYILHTSWSWWLITVPNMNNIPLFISEISLQIHFLYNNGLKCCILRHRQGILYMHQTYIVLENFTKYMRKQFSLSSLIYRNKDTESTAILHVPDYCTKYKHQHIFWDIITPKKQFMKKSP